MQLRLHLPGKSCRPVSTRPWREVMVYSLYTAEHSKHAQYAAMGEERVASHID